MLCLFFLYLNIMYNALFFTLSGVIVAVLIALIAAVAVWLLVTAGWSKRHNPLSIGVIVLVALSLMLLNVRFAVLQKQKSELEQFENSIEYRLMQTGTGLLADLSPDIASWMDSLIGDNISPQTINAEIERINKRMWLVGIGCLLVFVAGVFGAAFAADKGGRTSRTGRTQTREHRSAERVARHRHRD
jgi:uncharacterized membrane protein YbhN (UPF0104 family)